MQPNLNTHYWNQRWLAGETGWNLGTASPPIVEYMAQYGNKNARILIPGCGNAHEAAALLTHGFTNITLLDIAPEAAQKVAAQFAGRAEVNVVCGDFFLHNGEYDLLLEQTFFCALPPEMRGDYVKQAALLLCRQGQLAGVLFNREFDAAGPPFGGSIAEYRALFASHFNLQKLEPCTNSIAPRAGSEAFIHGHKKELPSAVPLRYAPRTAEGSSVAND